MFQLSPRPLLETVFCTACSLAASLLFRYMTQAATREALCSKGYSGHVCGHCEEG
jgi:hypothetical protein